MPAKKQVNLSLLFPFLSIACVRTSEFVPSHPTASSDIDVVDIFIFLFILAILHILAILLTFFIE